MKKFLSLMLAICFMICNITTVFASDIEYTEINEFMDTASSQVNYTVQSSYSVKIPVAINDVVFSGYSFQASHINILDTEIVRVYCENDVNMTNERGDTFEMRLYDMNGSEGSRIVASFNDQELTSSSVMLGRPVEMENLRAGYYQGSATFRVCIEPKPRS